MRTGVIARKIGMSRIFKDDGSNIPVTILQMDSCTVLQKKTTNTDGYNALSITFGKKEKNANKPIKGFFKKNNMPISKILREFRVSDEGFLDTGTRITCEHFVVGQKVDVTGFTIGKGFAGGMKRHNFAGNRATHGVSISHRSHGSTGQCQDPGKVFKGKKMAGRLGNVKRTMQNLEVIRTVSDDDLIIVKGSVPGPKGLFVTVSDAIKIVQNLPYPTSKKNNQENIENVVTKTNEDSSELTTKGKIVAPNNSESKNDDLNKEDDIIKNSEQNAKTETTNEESKKK